MKMKAYCKPQTAARAVIASGQTQNVIIGMDLCRIVVGARGRSATITTLKRECALMDVHGLHMAAGSGYRLCHDIAHERSFLMPIVDDGKPWYEEIAYEGGDINIWVPCERPDIELLALIHKQYNSDWIPVADVSVRM